MGIGPQEVIVIVVGGDKCRTARGSKVTSLVALS